MRAAFAAVLVLAGCSGPLKRAIADDDLPGIRTALDKGADVNKAFFAPQLEPAVFACRDGRFEALKLLVERGARVSGKFSVYSPLSLCALYGRLDMVKYLVAKGATIGSSELHWAKRHPHIYDYLVSVQSGSAPASAAASAPAPSKAPVSDVDAPERRGAERPNDFALIVGIEEYQSAPKADYGARDAATVKRHLEALGFPARNIITLTGPEATASKLKSYLEEWLPLNVKASSTLFFYYSGHGAPDVKTGDAYLVPWDGDPKFLKSTALPLTRLYADLSKTKAKRVIVALDACFSGAGGRSVLAKGARPLIARIADTAPVGGSLTVLAAASGDEITGSLDEQGHGMFTYHLLKGLAADPKASARSLFDYVMPRVQDDARRQNRVQTPVLAGAALSEPLLAP